MKRPDDSAAPRPQQDESHQPQEADRMTMEPDGAPYADRVFRSSGGIAGGVLLLALAAWLGGDAVVRGEGRTPWLALAGLLLVVPLVIAFTIRPAVFAGEDRLRVRNPFRLIILPWATVDGVRAGFTSEILAGGATYQLWAIPVSLRQRKRAARQQARHAAEDPSGRTAAHVGAADTAPAPADQAIADLRQLAEENAGRPTAQGQPEVRWAYEVIAPSAAGAVLLALLVTIG